MRHCLRMENQTTKRTTGIGLLVRIMGRGRIAAEIEQRWGDPPDVYGAAEALGVKPAAVRRLFTMLDIRTVRKVRVSNRRAASRTHYRWHGVDRAEFLRRAGLPPDTESAPVAVIATALGLLGAQTRILMRRYGVATERRVDPDAVALSAKLRDIGIGERPDVDVAADAGVPIKVVTRERRALGLQPVRPRLTSEEEWATAGLGIVPDSIAEQLAGRRSMAAITERKRRGIPAAPPIHDAEFLALKRRLRRRDPGAEDAMRAWIAARRAEGAT